MPAHIGDPDVIAQVQNIAKALHEAKAKANNADAPAVASTTVPINLAPNQKMFSEVFSMKPANDIPDFPVTIFSENDWHESIRARIPKPNPNYVFDKKALTYFMFALYTGGPILLYGPTGTGKTSLTKEVCALTNRPFLRVGCHRQMEASEFHGTTQVVNDNGVPITKHNHTDTTLAATYGGMLVVDEAFRSPILMAIQSLLETPPTLQLQDCQGMQSNLSPDIDRFNIVLTDNTNGTGDSNGSYIAEAQDLSTLTRVRTAVFIDYQSVTQETKMVLKSYPNITPADATNMAKTAKLVRDAFVKGTIMQVVDVRALLAWAHNFSIMGNMALAFNMSFGFKLSKEDTQIVNNCYRQVFGKDLI